MTISHFKFRVLHVLEVLRITTVISLSQKNFGGSHVKQIDARISKVTCRQSDTFSLCYVSQPWAKSVQFSCSVMSNSLWPHGLQHARLTCPSPTPGAYSNSCPLCQWCHPTISSSVVPSPPTLNLFQHQGLFKWVSSSHQVAKVLELQLQDQSFQQTFRTDFL